jgi:hypothetical protein
MPYGKDMQTPSHIVGCSAELMQKRHKVLWAALGHNLASAQHMHCAKGPRFYCTKRSNESNQLPLSSENMTQVATWSF